MGTSAAQIAEIRRDIARTRGEMSETIEALEQRLAETKESVIERVSPKRVWTRKTEGVRHKFDEVSVSIAGMTRRTENQVVRSKTKRQSKAQGFSEQAGDSAGALSEQAQRAPIALRERAEDYPLAAALVAVGAGFLLAKMLPPTALERQAAQRIQSELQPLKEQATQVGREIGGELKQSAQGSMKEIKGRASEAAQQVKEEAQSSAAQVKDQAQEASTEVKERSQSASRKVKRTASSEPPPTGPRRAPRRAPLRAGSV